MSSVIDAAVAVLAPRFAQGFDGVAKFVISGVGAIMVDGAGVRAADEPADVTLTAEADVFESILAGDTNPTAAFMQGKLTVDGDMGMALKLGGALG
jgi:putative sterol carrier protein